MWCARCSSIAASVDAGSCWCKGVGQCGGGQCDPVWAVEVFVLGEGLAESPFGGVKVAEHSVADALPVCDGAAVVHRAEYEVAGRQRGEQLQDDRGEVGAIAASTSSSPARTRTRSTGWSGSARHWEMVTCSIPAPRLVHATRGARIAFDAVRAALCDSLNSGQRVGVRVSGCDLVQAPGRLVVDEPADSVLVGKEGTGRDPGQ